MYVFTYILTHLLPQILKVPSKINNNKNNNNNNYYYINNNNNYYYY